MALYVDIKKDLGDFVLEAKFTAEEGVTGILGASGCGKSMTLRCIAGIMRPDEGRIELDGTVLFDSREKIDIKPQKRHTGLLFQNYALFPNMTVEQNLAAGFLPHEKDRKKAKAAVDEMMERFFLTELKKHRPSQLSGGQQQRAALARIFLSKPRVLMLDEPFSALDSFLRWNLELELSEAVREFLGPVLFVSHSREEVYRICDRVCVMERGRSSPVVPVRELFEAPISKAAALLSGCKNFSRAEKKPGNRVFAREWGMELSCKENVPDNVRHVGVRSHYITPVPALSAAGQENTFCCRILRAIEDVFSMILMVRPLSAGEECSRGEGVGGQIRVEVTKEFWEEFCRMEQPAGEIWIHMESKDIMLLL